MNFLEWMAVLGVLLLILALASAFLRWLPITTSLIYLGFGVLIGQLGIGLWEMEFLHIAGWMEHLTEVAVLVSLFVSGLKLRMPLRHPAWKSAYVLAGPVMLACIGGATLLCQHGQADRGDPGTHRPGAGEPWCRSTMPATATACATACPARRASTTAPRFPSWCSV